MRQIVTKMHIYVYLFYILNCVACLRTDLVSLLPAPCCSVHVYSVFDVTSLHKQLLCHLQAINTQNTHNILSENIKDNLNTISSLHVASHFISFWHVSLKIKHFRSYEYRISAGPGPPYRHIWKSGKQTKLHNCNMVPP